MDNKFGLLQEDIDAIISILKSEDAIEQAIIFGSRAKGNYKNGSDVDIAIKGEKVNINTITHILYLLNEETIMPYKFDILNYNTITNQALMEHIDRVGQILYSPL
jgi:predicted nucleotidyltransferase